MALTAIIQQDLSKGSNVSVQPYLLGKQQSVLLINMMLPEHGSLRVRDGSTVLGTSPDNPQAARPIIKLYNFILSPASPPVAPPAPPPGGPPIGGGEGTGGGDLGAPGGGGGGAGEGDAGGQGEGSGEGGGPGDGGANGP